MINPIKALKTEINDNVTVLRIFIAEYRYEKSILESQARLAETTLVPGHTNIYA